MTTINRAASVEAALSLCANDPDVRILRRVSSLQDFPLAKRVEGPTRFVAIVDTETTGTDPLIDEIIDIAVVTLEVDQAGQIISIVSAGQALRDPHMPIPAHIHRLTGITDDDVAGKSIDLDRLERRLAAADVRIAHNARFDIGFVENLLPGLAGAAWACSASDFDWVEAGFDGCKLGHLLMQAGYFNGAHRAMADVISLIHLLAHRLPDGGTVLGTLLANAERSTVRFEATGAPYDKRGLLKARGYRWDQRHRVWWSEIDEQQCAEEERWFRQNICAHGPVPRMMKISWHQRHR
ncbi:DNA polymerase III subunit epsilon [Stakelama sp. CBK3Z-3]|uniref:DNA polymerase III subunit epsilon n=1 Tax=Stakelama flava TaxID=2860338 RepID=A0ABS6XMF2_9SPHN|nr:3'-5' exonuclease [Stakelama flava]MBW4331382.1 DNA polymerase III subunit epsilon [Stakelama flava]